MNSPQAGHWRTTISWWIEASSFSAQHFFRRRLSSTRVLGSSVRPPSTVEGDAGWLPILPASRYSRFCEVFGLATSGVGAPELTDPRITLLSLPSLNSFVCLMKVLAATSLAMLLICLYLAAQQSQAWMIPSASLKVISLHYLLLVADAPAPAR